MADNSGTPSPEQLPAVELKGQQSSEGMPSQDADAAQAGSTSQAADVGEPSSSEAARGLDAPDDKDNNRVETASAAELEANEEPADQSEGGENAEQNAEAAAAGTSDAPPGPDGSSGEKSGRKRKRRKKHKGEGGAVEGAAAEEGAEAGGGKAKHKDGSNAPFSHFLAGSAGRRHAFAVGEEVAGRVVRCDRGAIVIDLFGKATAIADEFEPREIPPLREEAHAATSGDEGGAAAETGATEPVATDSVESAQTSTEATTPSETEAVASESAPVAGSEASASAEPANAVAETSTEGGASAAGLPSAEHTCALASDHEPIEDDSEDESEVPETAPQQPVLSPIEPGKVFKGRIGAIAESGHVALINRDIHAETVLATIESYRQERKRVQGVVFGFNRGGFDVIVEGIRAFCPASGMSFDEIEDPRLFIGQKLEFTLPPIKGGSKDLVVTRRSILEKERRKKVKELIRSLKPGQKIKGRVTQVRDYGLFVDIGGFEGLVHQSELSFSFGVKPQDVAQCGDEIDVQVVDVVSDGDSNKRDRNTRVSLSIKALLDDPWDLHRDAIAEGSVQAGKVTRTTDFGAFVELAPSVEGLLRIGELGRELSHANQAVKEGEEVYVVVERVDRRARRISLSKLSDSAVQDFKAGKLGDPTQKQPSLHPGARVMVKVESIEHRGLVVRVIGAAGKRSRAFLPSNETGTERGTDLRKAFPRNTEIEVKILGVERDGSLKCSRKALAIDDERRAIKEYRREAASQGLGTFGDLLRAKLGSTTRQ